MKLLPILLILVSLPGYAEEDCVFDEAAYIGFIQQYSERNKHANIGPDAKTLRVSRNNEEIQVQGGGCVHLGVAIEVKTSQSFTEKQFLQKTLDLASEFGGWLINTRKLKDSIEQGRYEKIDNTWLIEVDAMTVFSASYENGKKMNIDFYIN